MSLTPAMQEQVSTPSRRDPELLGRSLEQYLAHMGAPPVRTVTSLADRWAEIVGPAAAEHTRPVEVIDRVLTVVCDDAMWANQITWMDGQIKARFGELFPDTPLRRVSTRTAGSNSGSNSG